MIAEATTAAYILCKPMGTRGESDVATFVEQRSADGQSFLRRSNYFGYEPIFNQLAEIAENCKHANWDAQGAAAVSDEAYQAAYRFLEALPLGTPVPSVGAEPDGEMTLEWYHSPRRTLSISFSRGGEIHYAALLGPSRVYGTEPFFGEMPKRIMDIVSLVTTA